MRIVERTVIDRPAAQVWAHVIQPESFRRWNDKISSLDALGEFRVGQPFTTHFNWRGRVLQCASMPTDVQAGRVLELRHSAIVGPGVPPNLEIRQRITLEPHDTRTTVTKVISIENDDTPWFLRALVWFVTRFGAPTGPDPLKTLCEAGPPIDDRR
jgi:uncharacterized protein YndB with AHSA1/START domain